MRGATLTDLGHVQAACDVQRSMPEQEMRYAMTQPYPMTPNDPGQPLPPATHEPHTQPIHQPVPEEPIHPEIPEQPDTEPRREQPPLSQRVTFSG